MTTIELTVGYQERYKVQVKVSAFSAMTGNASVWVDGRRVPEEEIVKSTYSPGNNVANLTISIGSNERHSLEVRFGRWIWSKNSILVDRGVVREWGLLDRTNAKP